MTTYTEFMKEWRAAAEAKAAAHRAGAKRFIDAAEGHDFMLASGVVNTDSRTMLRGLIEGGDAFPTELACDRCGFALVYSKDMSRPTRLCGCAACGWLGQLPTAALVGAGWPDPTTIKVPYFGAEGEWVENADGKSAEVRDGDS